jgi:hypothetical protein
MKKFIEFDKKTAQIKISNNTLIKKMADGRINELAENYAQALKRMGKEKYMNHEQIVISIKDMHHFAVNYRESMKIFHSYTIYLKYQNS